jgi:hypothetical protein
MTINNRAITVPTWNDRLAELEKRLICPSASATSWRNFSSPPKVAKIHGWAGKAKNAGFYR